MTRAAFQGLFLSYIERGKDQNRHTRRTIATIFARLARCRAISGGLAHRLWLLQETRVLDDAWRLTEESDEQFEACRQAFLALLAQVDWDDFQRYHLRTALEIITRDPLARGDASHA